MTNTQDSERHIEELEWSNGLLQKALDQSIAECKQLQQVIDYRTKIENEAIDLISNCKFNEAIKLLKKI
ncbi:MAG: hypothetical protein PHR06_13870 [Candidatus Cloacimonetes bacterium]|nr:hypothetical protein [Candidatus Cloacimonadota bacterium]